MEDYVSGSAGYYTSPGAGATQYIADTSSYSHSYASDPATRIFDNVNTVDDNTIHDEDFGNLKFYNSASNQDNTYRNSNDDYRVKPKNMNFIYYDRGYHKPSDFETAAAALDLTLNSIGDTIGDVGLSFLGKLTMI